METIKCLLCGEETDNVGMGVCDKCEGDTQ
jgi:NMD protein affecting ribosome stability and mRNA decay